MNATSHAGLLVTRHERKGFRGIGQCQALLTQLGNESQRPLRIV
jgi:hypothetical protein